MLRTANLSHGAPVLHPQRLRTCPAALQSFTLSACEMCDWLHVEGTAASRRRLRLSLSSPDVVGAVTTGAAPSVLQATLLIEPGSPVETFSPTRCSNKCARCT